MGGGEVSRRPEGRRVESSSAEGMKEEMENGGPRSSSIPETGREVSGVCAIGRPEGGLPQSSSSPLTLREHFWDGEGQGFSALFSNTADGTSR